MENTVTIYNPLLKLLHSEVYTIYGYNLKRNTSDSEQKFYWYCEAPIKKPVKDG